MTQETADYSEVSKWSKNEWMKDLKNCMTNGILYPCCLRVTGVIHENMFECSHKKRLNVLTIKELFVPHIVSELSANNFIND